MSDTIQTGVHWVEAACPRCGAIEVVAVALHTVLTVPDDDTPSVRVRAKSKAVDHSCGQATLSIGLFTKEDSK